MTQDQSMIERVAQALGWREFSRTKLPAILGPEDPETAVLLQDWYAANANRLQQDARFAIEVMRQPTQAMLEAGRIPTAPIHLGNGTTTEGLGLGSSAHSMWPKMIDAALSDPTP